MCIKIKVLLLTRYYNCFYSIVYFLNWQPDAKPVPSPTHPTRRRGEVGVVLEEDGVARVHDHLQGLGEPVLAAVGRHQVQLRRGEHGGGQVVGLKLESLEPVLKGSMHSLLIHKR